VPGRYHRDILAQASHISVAVIGFSAFERNALLSAFRLSASREPCAYAACTDVAQAQLIVADADLAGILEDVAAAGRTADTVFVGSLPPSGARAWTMRPLDPQFVLRELDALSLRRPDEASETAGVLARAHVGPPPLTRADGVEVRGRRADDGDAFVISRPGNLGPR